MKTLCLMVWCVAVAAVSLAGDGVPEVDLVSVLPAGEYVLGVCLDSEHRDMMIFRGTLSWSEDLEECTFATENLQSNSR